jgi:hypothetical protein
MPTLRNRGPKAPVNNKSYEYTIRQEFRTGGDAQAVGRYGDFRETKDYKVIKNNGSGPINGIIVQYINKKTKVELAQPFKGKTILDSSSDIAALTNNNVKYMCDEYFEVFEIKNGEGDFGDQFQNGAVVPYEGNTPETDNAFDVSRGAFEKGEMGASRTGVGIIQVGLNVFIPEGPDATAVRKMGWSKNVKKPANGLPYLPFDAAKWEYFKQKSASPVFTHKVEVAWGYRQACKSVVISTPARAGGRRIRKTVRRRY